MINNMVSLGACMVAALIAIMQPALAAEFTACGITSTVAFQTWTKSLETKFPVIYPSNEGELRDIVNEVAKVPGCKIRVAGTKSAIDGLIALKQDPLVVVVSLADMQTHQSWDGVLDAKKGKVRMGAGKTLLDLVTLVRPQGFLPVSRSFGRYFSLGGFYLNPSTHGGTLDSDRVSKQVTAVRVLTSTGKYSVIKGNDIKHWRGSMGLLGIVVALEIKLTKDLGIVQVATQVSLPGPQWNVQNITGFLRAALQPADSAHFFYNVYDDTFLAVTTINGADPTFNKSNTAAVYAQLQQQYAGLAKTGFPILNVNDVLAQLPPGLTPLQIAGGVALNAMQTINGGWQLANAMARDGYVHDVTPSLSVNLLEVQIKCKTNCIDDGITFAALEGLRSILQASIGLSIWFPTLPVNFRYFVVKKTPAMTLDPHAPGTYMALELTNAKGIFPADKHSSVFRRVERFLKALANKSFPHLGKEYGFDMAQDRCDDEPGAFQDDTLAHTLYSAKAKQDFIKAMNKYDKKKLFRAGAVLHLLGLSEDKFDTRVPLGGDCALNRDCIDSCCCNYLPTCLPNQLLNKCVPCNSPLL